MRQPRKPQPCSELSSKREAALRVLPVSENNFHHWPARIKTQRDKDKGKGEARKSRECIQLSAYDDSVLILLEKAKEAHIKNK